MFKLGICAQFLSLSQCSAKPEEIVVSNAPAELQPWREIVGLILETGQET